jgi:hypothetical protein
MWPRRDALARNREREAGRRPLIHTKRRLGQRGETVKRFVHLD